MTVVRDGEKTWPPPPVQVSAAPAVSGRRDRRRSAAAEAEASAPGPPARPLVARGHRGAVRWSTRSPRRSCSQHFTVFVLAVVVGFYVIGNVHHALHTPLMSVTNAISGIIVVGALLQIGHRRHRRHGARRRSAILLASINIFGGFAVTRRMLAMFPKELSR